MSKSEIRGKHDEEATQLHRRSQSASLTYKEGPQIRGNGRAKANAPRGKDQGPQVSVLEKDEDDRLTRGAGRP